MKIIVQTYIFYYKKFFKNVKLSLYQQNKYFIERYLYIYLKKQLKNCYVISMYIHSYTIFKRKFNNQVLNFFFVYLI